MSFQNIDEIEEALRSDSVSVRTLHEIWEQRQPVAVPANHKSSASAASLGHQIAWIQQDSELAATFTRRLLDQQEFLTVCDAAREILRFWNERPGNDSVGLFRVRAHFAAALTRLGYTQEASRELEHCLHADFRPAPGRRLRAEFLRQLGDVRREEAHRASSRAMSMQAVEAALRCYQSARELEKESLETWVWLAALTLYVAGEHAARRTEARGIAQQLLTLAESREDTEGSRFATVRARAEALALLGRDDEAAAAYAELLGVEDGSIPSLAEARYRTRFLADALDKPRDFLHAAFPPLHLIVFSGHLPDLPGQPVRFPMEQIGPARAGLQAKLNEMRAHIGMASAAAGADLLFLDALRERPNSPSHVVLPWSEDEFRRTSVHPYEPEAGDPVWTPLFDKAIREAASVRQLGEFYAPGSGVGWEYMAEVTAGLALHTADALRLDLQPLVLWDGLPGRGSGGTSDFVRFWRTKLGTEPIIVPLPSAGVSATGGIYGTGDRIERSVVHQEVKTMLFGDIVGYSKLTEQVIPEFISCFLDKVSQLVATSRHAPQSLNTWGDAIYAVFDFAIDAGNFALELIRMIHDGREEWIQRGLFWEEPAEGDRPAIKHPLNIRVGLHTGPVFMHADPVVRRLGFTGAHVNRAARIEPVTQPGEAFASEEFVALAELNIAVKQRAGEAKSAAFACEYAGSMTLAKGYPGRYRIYRLTELRALDVEELGIAIHELYCEEARKRNETPQTNAALRPWAELPENMRDASREQAADIPNKLRVLGYELVHRGGIEPGKAVFDPELVEELAKHEHERWRAERQRNGWTYADIRDNARKHHPLLVDWDHLSEVEKEKDRDTVRNLPILIDKAGFRVRTTRLAA
jgi:class 3 adenylate cyclase/tetratricopeptide (TPR) repeat protein